MQTSGCPPTRDHWFQIPRPPFPLLHFVFPIPHVSEVVRYLSFSDLSFSDVSLSIIPSGSIHVVANGEISFLWPSDVPLCMEQSGRSAAGQGCLPRRPQLVIRSLRHATCKQPAPYLKQPAARPPPRYLPIWPRPAFTHGARSLLYSLCTPDRVPRLLRRHGAQAVSSLGPAGTADGQEALLPLRSPRRSPPRASGSFLVMRPRKRTGF